MALGNLFMEARGDRTDTDEISICQERLTTAKDDAGALNPSVNETL